MATTTFHDYDGNGSTTTFAFTFPTFKEAEVVVEVDNVIKTTSSHYNITSYSTANGGNVVFTSGNIPAAGTKNIRIYRDTDVDNAKATYTAGSSVKAGDLNNNQLQALRSLQEEQNQTVNAAKLKDGSVTSAKIADGAIVNADINASAAIALSKLGTGTLPSGIAVNSDNIAPGTILVTDLADDSITNAKINSSAAIAQSKLSLDADLTTLSSMQTGAATKLAALTATEIETLDGVTATTAELNYVDGVTSNVQTQLNAKQASDTELTELATMHTDTASALADLTQAEVQILDGATVTTDELNKLDGVTSTATNLNIVSGMTKQTTITDQDTSYPTSGAVVDYVAGQIAPIGGLEVIANKDSFPETQPASGVVISIADAGGIVVNGSGTSTTPDTITTDATVTINNINSSFNSSTVDAGVGWLVTSTGSGQIYNYHKANIKESDVVQLSDDINDFNSRYRVAGSAPGSNNDEGDLYFDTGANKMYVYDGSSWGEVTSTGDFKYLVPCAFNTGTGNAAVFNGSISKYDLRENSTSGSLASVTNAAQLMVSVNGVVQKPNTGTSIGSNDGFCMVDGHTIEFGANIPANSEVFVVQSGSALSINVPGDATVSEAKLNVSNSPTNGYYLQAQSGNTGGLTWAAVSQYTTPLTTRGDILFRDASGDQRLAKGTAGQYLKIGANDPEWADVVGAVADGCIFENDQTISNDYTIASGKGAHSVGPITVNATVTVNGNWVVS
tara:strand:+ start:852 stop:3053 length:2202 start_codon:yes stop_codon:yes gene_type:complete